MRQSYPVSINPELVDTAYADIIWEPMTAFLEYYENVCFNAAGFYWFIVTGESRLSDGPNTYKWEYWYRAVPIADGVPYSSRCDLSKEVKAMGFDSMKAAQLASVAAVRAYKSAE